MTADIEFKVIGVPHPQGSKSAFVVGKRAVVVDGSSKTGREKHKVWRTLVAEEAQIVAEKRGGPFTGPVSVTIAFRLPVVKSDPYRSRHTTKPDIDKLGRSCLDSMVDAGLLRDDSLVFELTLIKHYAVDAGTVGANITVRDETDLEQQSREFRKAAAKVARKK